MSRRHPFFIGNNMENNHEKYMFDALREAQRAAAEDEVPIGAVIVCQGRIIAKGHNMTERLNDPTAHAEMIAITAATEAVGGKYLNDCTLYVTVEPCPMCAGALAWSQIGKVVYGASDPKRGFSRFSPSLMHPKTEIVSGIMAEECGNIVSEFFQRKRK
jgi:tRNA(adenine34) deaminase